MPKPGILFAEAGAGRAGEVVTETIDDAEYGPPPAVTARRKADPDYRQGWNSIPVGGQIAPQIRQTDTASSTSQSDATAVQNPPIQLVGPRAATLTSNQAFPAPAVPSAPGDRADASGGLNENLLFACIMALLVVGIYLRVQWQKRKRGRALIQKVSTPIAEEIEKNAGPLRVKRLHTTQPDKYGTIPWQKWDRATVHYMKTRILSTLLASNASSVTFDWLRLVDSSIEEASRRPWTPAMAEQHGYVSSPECFDVRMDPLDYEAFCSLQLGKAGWVTRLTVATHDQGADIVAERSGRKLVVQRKLYSSPVGNEAVQQVHAAMTFQLADLAAVVSNQPFTRSAHQLAGVNGVRLLHHDQLPAFTG